MLESATRGLIEARALSKRRVFLDWRQFTVCDNDHFQAKMRREVVEQRKRANRFESDYNKLVVSIADPASVPSFN